MKTILITVVLAACAALGGAAMPTKEEAERAEPLVRKLMASERAALASGKKTRSEVAAAALKLAGETDTEAAKLLLMKGAFVLYVKDGNLEKAVETMNTLEKAIADVPPQCVTNMIETALLGASKKDDGARLYRLLDAAKENVGEASPPPHDGTVVQKRTVVDGYAWSYRVNNGEATIEAMKDGKYVCAVSPNPTGDVVIPSMLNGVKVTSVGREVFCYCSGLKSVRIPEGVKNVGWCAFYNCTNLVAVTLPQNLKSIGHGAFAGCCGLTEVTIPAGVTNIDADAFLACTKIKSIAIPSGVKCIKEHAFDLCSGLTQVAIPSSVESIGRQAFFNCNGLKSLTISSGVKNIDSIAFANCDELAQVVLLGERPKSSEDVFQNCQKLKAIHVPANAKSWAGMKEWQGIPLVFDGKETVNGCTWSFRVSNGEATIVANTDVWYSCAVSPKPNGYVPIPATLGGARVTSIGRDAFWELGGLTSVSIPSSVTNIGYCAFHGCGGLTSVTIPPSVVRIERGAFYGCEGLKSVTMSEGVTRIGSDAFACCNGLTAVTIPASVKTIEDGVFRKCGELISVTMLGERPNAPANAICDNGKLKAIHVPANAKSWAGMKEWQGIPLVFDGKETVDGYTWSYCVRNGEVEIVAEEDGKFSCAVSPSPKGAVTIPSTLGGKRVTHIGQSAFKGCSGMSSVTIPSDVKNIGPWAFEGCSGLTSLAIPDGVTTIEGCTFSGCGGLKSVMIPPSVTTISDAAFVYCDGLTSMTIPPTVKELRTQVFFCCRALESVTIPASVEKIGWAAFAYSGELKEINVEEGNRWFASVDGVLYTKDMTELVACPNAQTSLTIPSSVKKLRDAAILGCGKLESLTIPEGVSDIGWQALKDCVSLKTVTIPSTVGSIAEIAFWNCRSLTSVTIPVGVARIGKRAFGNCGALTSVTMLCERPNAPDDVFKGCGKLKAIHVPANAKSWAGMKEWQGIPLVFDAKLQVAKDRTTVQSIIDGMIKVPGRDFWLSATEVTQGQWEAVMGYNISTHKGANLPVENVSRDECAVFFEKLNETKAVLLTRFEFGLPTLVEWTYAAQAGGSELDCWIKPGVVGDVFDMAWVAENSSNQTHVVATKAANAFGFYDMLGNVWEWMDCKEENVGCRHGGSFRDPAADCTVRKGYHNPRNRRFDCYGLRVAAHIRSAVEVCPDEK